MAGETCAEKVIAQKEMQQLLQLNNKIRLLGSHTACKLTFNLESILSSVKLTRVPEQTNH